MSSTSTFDVIIIGGSYAGLSAGMTFGRSLRRVLIIDGGKPCNAQTPHSHNFLTQDGSTPREIATLAKSQVLRYPTVTFLDGEATQIINTGALFQVTTTSGRTFDGRKILLATGIRDRLPSIAGLKESWGISVLHCPYCHGYEVAGRRLGVLANGDTGYELAKLIGHWSKTLTLFTNGASTLSAQQQADIKKWGVPVVEQELTMLDGNDGYIREVVLNDGSRVALDAIFTRAPFEQPAIVQQLGVDFTEMNFIRIDEFGKTSVDGIFAAGDNSSPMRSVSNAVAMGTKAAAFLNRLLIDEDLKAL
ncbi:NAD(P)/FAD-dependent oxidoreductase [Dawidia soli]|uniref:NAD(P)/FAD-dependent oxidoreductase n=1 Tax=Dawidia soli TaxID=2782352 RepID=A0AAP2D9B5_9BACT|nr:NAD(P)/FAD-dependent oxidoreductase [Dawidia soli]MBT1687751.1 NAD(P)/FAD-dependent oxidoreductase [Dawidia soli]